MTKICDITPVTLRGFLRYMVLNCEENEDGEEVCSAPIGTKVK